MNLVRGHGSDIQEVSGKGNPRAASTVNHPLGKAIDRSLPLRANQRMVPLASQAVARPSVVRPERRHRCKREPPRQTGKTPLRRVEYPTAAPILDVLAQSRQRGEPGLP